MSFTVASFRFPFAVDDSGIVRVIADYREDEYRVLCRNGSASSRLGLLVDSNCALGTGIVGEVSQSSLPPAGK